MSRFISKDKKYESSGSSLSSDSTPLPKRTKTVEIENVVPVTKSRKDSNEEIKINSDYHDTVIQEEEDETQDITHNGNEIIRAKFVEGYSISKAFSALGEGVSKQENIILDFDEDTISIDQNGINANTKINLTIFTSKLLEYSFNEKDGFLTRISVTVDELINKVSAKKSEGLTFKIVSDKTYPFLVSHGDIFDNNINVSHKAEKVDVDPHIYENKPVKIKTTVITSIFKSCSSKNDDHIIIDCFINGLIITGYKKDGSLAFNGKHYGNTENQKVSSIRIEKKTIKMLEKQGSMAPAYSITEIYVEEGKPICIKTPIGLVGEINVYIYI